MTAVGRGTMGTGSASRGASSAVERLARVGLVMLAGFVGVAVLAPIIAPFDPTAYVGDPFARPGDGHLLGTNDVGQDLFSELVYASRISLVFGLVIGVAATAMGLAVGLVSGFVRGRVDGLLMRVVDVVLVIPFLPLLLVLAAYFGGGVATELAVIAAVSWARPARELRAQTMSLRTRDHVQASIAMGASTRHVLVRHILPGVAALAPPMFVRAAKGAILLETSLSFLGLGDPSVRSWGTMLYYANARSAFLTDAWAWWVLPPGLCIGGVVVAFALVGYRLERWGRPGGGRGAAGATGATASGPVRAKAPETAERRAEAAPEVGEPRVEADTEVCDPRTREAAEVGGPRTEGAPSRLEIRDLSVAYGDGDGRVDALDGVGLRVEAGEILGVIGESGSGKTTLVRAVLGLLRPPARLLGGTIRFEGADVASPGGRRLRALRGRRIALVPQSGLSSLDPTMRVSEQVAEAMAATGGGSWREARARAAELLGSVGIPADRHRDYPHEFSGGMRQRVLIAMALVNEPDLILADEPTTGLDGPTGAAVLELFEGLAGPGGHSVVLVSHDLPAVASIADRLVVMRGGRIVESGPSSELARAPRHEYTRALLAASRPARLPGPRAAEARGRPPEAARALVVTGLNKRFRGRGAPVAAVSDVSFEIGAGEILGLVGRSGAGKSTVARLVFGLESPDAGTIVLPAAGAVRGGAPPGPASAPSLLAGERRAPDGEREWPVERLRQLVLQDPYAALPPHLSVGDIIAEPLRIYGARGDLAEEIAAALARVELSPVGRYRDRFPHELSGGERQRVALARALVPDPALVVADEPASLLDASLKWDVVSRLARLRAETGIAVLYITHDIGLAAAICDRLAVMEAGRIVETGPTAGLLDRPDHPATRELVRAWRVLAG